jgi:hypothetical protein
MARARLRGTEYEVVNFTEDAEVVLRDDAGEVSLFEQSQNERVEVRCDRCGRWTTSITAFDRRWVCTDAGCYEAERRGR